MHISSERRPLYQHVKPGLDKWSKQVSFTGNRDKSFEGLSSYTPSSHMDNPTTSITYNENFRHRLLRGNNQGTSAPNKHDNHRHLSNSLAENEAIHKNITTRISQLANNSKTTTILHSKDTFGPLGQASGLFSASHIKETTHLSPYAAHAPTIQLRQQTTPNPSLRSFTEHIPTFSPEPLKPSADILTLEKLRRVLKLLSVPDVDGLMKKEPCYVEAEVRKMLIPQNSKDKDASLDCSLNSNKLVKSGSKDRALIHGHFEKMRADYARSQNKNATESGEHYEAKIRNLEDQLQDSKEMIERLQKQLRLASRAEPEVSGDEADKNISEQTPKRIKATSQDPASNSPNITLPFSSFERKALEDRLRKTLNELKETKEKLVSQRMGFDAEILQRSKAFDRELKDIENKYLKRLGDSEEQINSLRRQLNAEQQLQKDTNGKNREDQESIYRQKEREARDRFEAMSKERNGYKRDLDDAMKKLEISSKELIGCNKKIEEQKALIDGISKEKESHRKLAEEAIAEVKVVGKEKETLRREVEQLKKESDDFRREKESSKIKIDEASKRVESLLKERDLLKKQVEDSKREIDILVKENTGYQGKVDKEKKSYEATLKERDQVKTQLEESRSEIRVYIDRCKILEKECTTLHNRYQEAENTIEMYKHAAATNKEENMTLRTNCENAKKSEEVLQSSLAITKKQLETITSEKNTLSKEVAKVHIQLETMRNDLESAKKDLDDKSRQVDLLNHNLAKATSAATSSANSQIKEIVSEYEEFREQMARQFEEKDHQIRELKAAGSTEVEELTGRLQVVTANSDTFEKKAVEAEKRVEELEKELEKAAAKHQGEQQRAVDSLQQQVETATTELEKVIKSSEKTINDLKEELEKVRADHDSALVQLQTVTKGKSSADDEISSLKEKYSGLERKLELLSSIDNQKQELAEKYESQIKDLQHQLEKTTKQNGKLEDEMKMRIDEIESLTNQLGKLSVTRVETPQHEFVRTESLASISLSSQPIQGDTFDRDQSEIDDRLEELKKRENLIEKQNEEIANWKQQFDKFVEEKTNELRIREGEIEARDNDLKSKLEGIFVRKMDLDKKEANLQEREDDIKHKLDLLKITEKQVEEMQQQVWAERPFIDEKNEIITNLQSQIEELKKSQNGAPDMQIRTTLVESGPPFEQVKSFDYIPPKVNIADLMELPGSHNNLKTSMQLDNSSPCSLDKSKGEIRDLDEPRKSIGSNPSDFLQVAESRMTKPKITLTSSFDLDSEDADSMGIFNKKPDSPSNLNAPTNLLQQPGMDQEMVKELETLRRKVKDNQRVTSRYIDNETRLNKRVEELEQGTREKKAELARMSCEKAALENLFYTVAKAKKTRELYLNEEIGKLKRILSEAKASSEIEIEKRRKEDLSQLEAYLKTQNDRLGTPRKELNEQEQVFVMEGTVTAPQNVDGDPRERELKGNTVESSKSKSNITSPKKEKLDEEMITINDRIIYGHPTMLQSQSSASENVYSVSQSSMKLLNLSSFAENDNRASLGNNVNPYLDDEPIVEQNQVPKDRLQKQKAQPDQQEVDEENLVFYTPRLMPNTPTVRSKTIEVLGCTNLPVIQDEAIAQSLEDLPIPNTQLADSVIDVKEKKSLDQVTPAWFDSDEENEKKSTKFDALNQSNHSQVAKADSGANEHYLKRSINEGMIENIGFASAENSALQKAPVDQKDSGSSNEQINSSKVSIEKDQTSANKGPPKELPNEQGQVNSESRPGLTNSSYKEESNSSSGVSPMGQRPAHQAFQDLHSGSIHQEVLVQSSDAPFQSPTKMFKSQVQAESSAKRLQKAESGSSPVREEIIHSAIGENSRIFGSSLIKSEGKSNFEALGKPKSALLSDVLSPEDFEGISDDDMLNMRVGINKVDEDELEGSMENTQHNKSRIEAHHTEIEVSSQPLSTSKKRDSYKNESEPEESQNELVNNEANINSTKKLKKDKHQFGTDSPDIIDQDEEDLLENEIFIDEDIS